MSNCTSPSCPTNVRRVDDFCGLRPELFVLYTTVLLAGFEGRHTEWRLTGLASRVGTVVTAFLVAFIVYEGGAASFATTVPGVRILLQVSG